jgi:hypothetical protein
MSHRLPLWFVAGPPRLNWPDTRPAAVIRQVGWRDRQACAGACGREDPVALQERIEVAICDLQLSCGYVLRLLIVGVSSVLPEAFPLLVIAVLRCLRRG